MASVEQEIWNIFTFYTLHGNPLDPEHIRCTQFVKLARDCQLVGSTLSEADPPLLEADIQVAYTAEVKRHDRGAGSLQKMNYNDFLTAMMKIAIKVYPRSRTVDEAFQRLLMDNVLPLASRRCPDNIDMFLESEDVQRLFAYYSDALEGIFTFYATSDKRSNAALAASAVKAGHVSGPYAASHGAMTVGGKSPSRATRSANTMKEAMGYPEFLKFATDFDLSSSVILSTLELGDIFLSSIRTLDHDSTIRKLTFPEFWEVLVRCALVAYSKISDSSVIDKIRGLFLYMWRSINRSVPRAFSERRNVSTYAGDLLAGAMLFNKRFTAAWSADGYRDYLSPDSAKLETGKAVLSRLLRPGVGGTAGAAAGSAGSPSASMGLSGGFFGGDAAATAGSAAGRSGPGGVSGYIGVPAATPSAYGHGSGTHTGGASALGGSYGAASYGPGAAGYGPGPAGYVSGPGYGPSSRPGSPSAAGMMGGGSGGGASMSASAAYARAGGAGAAPTPVYYGSGLVVDPHTGTAIASPSGGGRGAGYGASAAAARYAGGVSEYGY